MVLMLAVAKLASFVKIETLSQQNSQRAERPGL
jgi:hypothetical protein